MKKLILATAAIMALSATGAMADGIQAAKKGTIKLDVRLTSVTPRESGKVTTAAGAATGLDVSIGNSIVPTLGIEYYLTDNVSVEAIAGVTPHTVKATNATTNLKVARVWILPPNITAKYHFNTGSALVPYVGAGYAHMLYYDVTGANGFQVGFKNKGGLALQAGADYNTASKMSYNFDVKYDLVKTDAAISGGLQAKGVKVNPLVVSLGVGYKF